MSRDVPESSAAAHGWATPLESAPRDNGRTPGGGRSELPPLWKRVWICVRGWKAWRTRIKIDKAACVLWNQGIDDELAHRMTMLSLRLWSEAWAAGDSASDRERKSPNDQAQRADEAKPSA